MPKELTADYLDSLYRHADSLDLHVFDRFVSYERLSGGDHFYQQMRSRLRDNRSWEKQFPKSRLRLVQNHISRYVNVWSNSILDLAPDVDILPDNPREEQDKKAATLNRSVKAHIIEETDFYSLQEELVKDFIVLGEAILKISFNPGIGPLVPGQVHKILDQETGQIFNLQDMMPGGLIEFERIEPENLLRDPMARTWLDARWVCHRHMMDKQKVIRLIREIYKDDRNMAQEKINSLVENDETRSAYSGTENIYGNEEENRKVLIREFFWRPEPGKYPKGRYAMATKGEIILESDLPAGIFPFEFVNFESNHGTPRGESRIKQLAPIQLEINRCVSKMAEHQITLGDDKIISTAGSKIAEVNKYEGVRLFQVTGGTVPQILEGRSGAQYLDHLINQVATFDKIAEMSEISEDKISALDPFAIFFLTSRQKKKFAKHASKFERFLIRIWKKTLKLHKKAVHPNTAIKILGASEKINIDEYKSMDDLGFQVKLKARTEDPESLIARQFQINQFLQYGNLSEADFGALAKESPFFHKSDVALQSILRSERAQNMILKLDKGLDLPVSVGDDPKYMLQRLDTRMSSPDYDTITHRAQNGLIIPTEQIHEVYERKRQEYVELQAQQMQQKLQMEQGFVPSTGRMIPVQMYDSKVNDDGSVSSKRVLLPNDSLEYLIKLLQAQNVTMSTLQGFSSETQAELASQLTSQSVQPGQDSLNNAAITDMGEV